MYDPARKPNSEKDFYKNYLENQTRDDVLHMNLESLKTFVLQAAQHPNIVSDQLIELANKRIRALS